MSDFKVGDIVTFCEKNNVRWQGGTGRVTAVNEGAHPYEVLILEGPPLNTLYRDGGKTVNASSDWIKLLEPGEFKVGDIVKVKPGGFIYCAHENKTLIVDRLHEEMNHYRYGVRALGEDYLLGHSYKVGELEAGEQLAEWEIELLDYRSPKLEAVKAAHPSNGRITPVSDPTFDGRITKNDVVNDPSHYGGKDNPYEVIKVAEAWGFNENAYLFNALKYLGRAGKKGSKVEDLKKLVYYAEREIALEEAK